MSKHFEEIWCEAETMSAKRPANRDELLIKLQQELQEYYKLDNIPSKEIQKILRTKKFGEILFKLSELSRSDDVNTYAALQMEVQIAEKSIK